MKKNIKMFTAFALVTVLGLTYTAYPIYAFETVNEPPELAAFSDMAYVQQPQTKGANNGQTNDLPVVLPEDLTLNFPGVSVALSKESSAGGNPLYRGDIQFTQPPTIDLSSAKPCKYDNQTLKLTPDDTLWAPGKTFYINLFNPTLDFDNIGSLFLFLIVSFIHMKKMAY